MDLTVGEAAELAGVSEKTIRVWIAEGGAPLLKAGDRGPGNGAIIDGARFPSWLQFRRLGSRAETVGARLQKIGTLPNGGNPFRGIVEFTHHETLHVMAVAWRSFLEDGTYKQWGLDEQQARTVAWRAWAMCAMYLRVHMLDGPFEAALKRDTENDLDDWASLLFQSDFRTDWSNLEQLEMPAELVELVPDDVRARLTATSNVRDLPRRRRKPKGNGRA